MNVSRRSFCTTLAAGLAMGMFAGTGAAFAADDKAAELKTVEQGKLIMGTNATFPPYEYYDGDKIVGIDADVAALIADKLGLELEIEDMDFGAIITAVQTGKIDMGLAGITVNDERKKNVSFTDTYASGVQVIIVTEDSPISSPDDLANNADFLIGVQENTTGHIYAAEDYGQDRVIPYTSGPTAVQALQAGKVDCVIIDNEPAKNYVEANKGLKILDTAYVEEDYAIAVNKDNTALLDAINGALKELIADGSVKKVIDTYINDGSEDKDASEDKGGSYKDGSYTAEGKGIGGKVPVTVEVKDGKVATVTVGDNSETHGIGSKAIEQLPEAIVAANGTEGVDAVSGATVTSKAIFTAVDEALEQAGTTDVAPAGAEAEEPAAEADALADGTYTSSARCSVGIVPVTVTYEDGKAVRIEIENDSALEEDDFKAVLAAIIGCRSQAVRAAVEIDRTAVENAVAAAEFSVDTAIEAASAAETAAPAAEPGTLTSCVLADGTYTASGKGFDGEVPVTVTIEGGKIASVTVGYNYATSGIGLMAINQLPSKIVAANGTEGVDAVSGATVTSKAIFTAVNSCLKQAAS